jgi:heme-degrading monooxygenase HmoA
MFARLARYAVPADRIDDAVESFRTAGAALRELEGFVDGYLLVDHDDGTTMTLTLWRDRTALESSATRAGAMRLRAVHAVDGSCESVAEYEVPLEFGSGDRGTAQAEADSPWST